MDDNRPVEDGPSIEIVRRLVRRLLPSALFKEKWAETKYTDTQVPTYNAATGKFEPGTPSGSGAPTDADYLVGTANATLSAEIVVGTTPGGELGGTWASPTVDATHSGSTHAATQAAAEATAAAALTGHEGAADPHTGYRLESADHSHATTGAQAGQLDHGAAMTGASLADDDHGAYLLASDATNRATFAANWLDLTDTGATTLHTHSGGSGHTIREDGSDLTARTGLNFVDTDVAAAVDDAAGDETEVRLNLYTALAGRSGGQTIIGGTGANEDITLQGSSNGTRTTSAVIIADHLDIATGKVIKYNGTTLLTPSATIPHLTLTGGMFIDHTGATGAAIAITPTVSAATAWQGINCSPAALTISGSGATINAILGQVVAGGGSGATGNSLFGLNFLATGGASNVTTTFTEVTGLSAVASGRAQTNASAILTVTGMWGGKFSLTTVRTLGGSITVTNGYGVDIPAPTHTGGGTTNTITNYTGLRVRDYAGGTATTLNYLCNIGGGTSDAGTVSATSGLLRVMGKFSAAANETPVYISEGATPTLRQLKTFDPGNAGANFTAGQLVCVLV